MNILPTELWIKILKSLSVSDVMRLAKVSKFFFYLTKEYRIWKLDVYEGLKVYRYERYLTFLNHCNKLTYFEDFSLNNKYYISDYPILYKNNLKTIKIRFSDISQIKFLEANPDVEYLHIKCGANISNKLLVGLFEKLRKLKYLYINNLNLEGQALKTLNKFKLKSLELESCYGLENFSVLENENFETLSIISHRPIARPSVDKLISKQKSLKNLTLSLAYPNLWTVSKIAKIGKNLKSLNLSYPQEIVDDLSLCIIANNCKELESLNLNSSDVTSRGIKYLTMGCKNITKLGLGGTFINDMALVYISQFYQNITSLEVEFNNISRIGVFNILLRCKDLKYLNILNNHFTAEYLDKVYKQILK